MDFAHLFIGFLLPVAFGSIVVFAVFGIVHLRTPHRAPAVPERQSAR